MTPAAALTRFAISAVPSAPALGIMRLSLLDWISVGRAAAGEPVSQIIREMVHAEGGQGPAQLFGGGPSQPARSAALVNGTISHALDYDDTHFAHIGHPSVAVLPAALAVAQSEASSGSDFLDAALTGVEASIRTGLWLGRSHYQAGFHQTATAGAFGATLAAARLMGLDAAQTETALNLAATRASGLKAQFGTMGKPYNAGIAAATGVEVAQLARLGMTAAPDGMGGAFGFGTTHHGAGDMSAFEPTPEWLFKTVNHKFHACCHGTHAALEALTTLTPQIAGPIEAVRITTHPRWLSVCDIKAPRTGLEVKFSYTHTAAMALSGHNTAQLGSFSDAVAQDPALVALARKVRVDTDESLPETASHVRVQTSAQAFEATHDLATPLSHADLTAKLKAKSVALLGAQAAKDIARVLTEDLTPAEIGALLSAR